MVFSFSGSVNTTDVTANTIDPSPGSLANSQVLIFGAGSIEGFGPTSGPGTIPFGASLIFATSSTGDIFGLSTTANTGVGVPVGYVSGSALSGSATYAGSFTSLGMTPGTYTWTWGSGANADSAVLTIGSAPSPAAAPGPLPLFGAAAAYTWSRRLRRRCAQG